MNDQPPDIHRYVTRRFLNKGTLESLRYLARYFRLYKGIDQMSKRQLVKLILWRVRRPDMRYG
jgi:hypothetical protein